MKADLFNGDSAKILKSIPDESIDMTITSPPYDDIRDYKGFVFDFETIASELWRVTKQGGVVVWIVGDGVVDGSETMTSFRQAIYFNSIGFNLHDTMIWQKRRITFPNPLRYGQCFEYMFIFSKGKPKTVNKIKDRLNIWSGSRVTSTERQKDGSLKVSSARKKGRQIAEYGERFNVWEIDSEKNNQTGHPAVYPVKLVKDHIISWSNKGEVVLDPFMGSGTTGIACYETDRDFIGIEISEEYFIKAKERIDETMAQMKMII